MLVKTVHEQSEIPMQGVVTPHVASVQDVQSPVEMKHVFVQLEQPLQPLQPVQAVQPVHALQAVHAVHAVQFVQLVQPVH